MNAEAVVDSMADYMFEGFYLMRLEGYITRPLNSYLIPYLSILRQRRPVTLTLDVSEYGILQSDHENDKQNGGLKNMGWR